MRPDLQAMFEEAQRGIEQVLADLNTAPDERKPNGAVRSKTEKDKKPLQKPEASATYIGLEGKFLSQGGNRYIYQYTLDTTWEPETNSQINIALDSSTQEHYSARVISCSEAILMFSTYAPLPATWLKRALFREDRAWLLLQKKQILGRYLDGTLKIAPGNFGTKISGLQSAQFGKQKMQKQGGSFVPNKRQLLAIERSLGSEQTWIIGAAGTGKSSVQEILICQFLKQGKSVLVCSNTNIATDRLFLGAIQAIELSGDADLLRLLPQHLVRAGEPHHPSLRIGAYHHLTVSALAEARMGNLADIRRHLEEAQDMLAKKLEHQKQIFQREEKNWQKQQMQLDKEMKRLQETLAPLEEQERLRIEQAQQASKQTKEQHDAAMQQLMFLDEQLADLEKQLAEWEGRPRQYTDEQEPGEQAHLRTQLEEAQRHLTSLEKKGRLQRWLAGSRYEQEMTETQQEVEAKQQTLAEANDRITSIRESLRQNKNDQITLRTTIKQAENEMARLQVYLPPPNHIILLREEQEALRESIQTGKNRLEGLQAKVIEVKTEQGRNETQLADLKMQLAAFHTQIIADARLVATTITGLYIHQALLRGQWDVVIIDEISMVSFLDAFVASLHAIRHLIATGDPMQLLPILRTMCREQDREQQMPEAVKWLAWDLLSYRGITIFDAIAGAKNCILLREQGRMHPRIFAPINHLVYQDSLTSRPETENAPSIAPLPSSPLLLVDSSQSSESKTSKKPNTSEARVNKGHVKIIVALIPQILATLPQRSARQDPSAPRIGILTPYRSQVKLLTEALRKAGLLQEVRVEHMSPVRELHVGTINTAQALQFDVVVLDTVEAPGFRPIPFIYDRILDDKDRATDATRRLNVAHTRARYKMIYVAHLQHLRNYQPKNQQNSRNRRLLLELVEWAAQEGRISSLEIVQ